MAKTNAKSSPKKAAKKPSARPANPPAELGDWRADMLRQVRKLIMEADPGITEEVKWRKPSNPAGVPVWYRDGMICTGETYKNYVKITFAQGAGLADPAKLFNAGQAGNVRRAIDIHEGGEIDESAFKDLIRAAVALNQLSKKK
jgi:hypothetical protein